MRIKISFAFAYDFNQLIYVVCSLPGPSLPCRFRPLPHSLRFWPLPLPAPPHEKKLPRPPLVTTPALAAVSIQEKTLSFTASCLLLTSPTFGSSLAPALLRVLGSPWTTPSPSQAPWPSPILHPCPLEGHGRQLAFSSSTSNHLDSLNLTLHPLGCHARQLELLQMIFYQTNLSLGALGWNTWCWPWSRLIIAFLASMYSLILSAMILLPRGNNIVLAKCWQDVSNFCTKKWRWNKFCKNQFVKWCDFLLLR